MHTLGTDVVAVWIAAQLTEAPNAEEIGEDVLARLVALLPPVEAETMAVRP